MVNKCLNVLPKIFTFHQSGGILPNLVTLIGRWVDMLTTHKLMTFKTEFNSPLLLTTLLPTTLQNIRCQIGKMFEQIVR